MEFRKTKAADLPRLMEIFAHARDFMQSTGNPYQWAPTYPSVEQLMFDINSGDSYVCLDDKTQRIVATFLLRGGIDHTYDVIYEGQWPHARPYATIHRIASSGEVKGVFDSVLQFALTKYETIRIDTHRDNQVIQHIIQKAGFVYCGIIHCWNGDERLAYQLG